MFLILRVFCCGALNSRSAHSRVCSSADVAHRDASAADCYSFTFSFLSNLKDALWVASGPATMLGSTGTFQWVLTPASNDMVLSLHSTKYVLLLTFCDGRSSRCLQWARNLEHYSQQERLPKHTHAVGSVASALADDGYWQNH